jgi:uncharacterized protein YbjT (DUF2867 family)
MQATVFGGTGFLGRRVVEHLLARGAQVRIVARHASSVAAPPGAGATSEPFDADIRDDEAVAAAVAGADLVVNAVGLYVERGELTFEAVHQRGAARVAERARDAGVHRLLHVSGVGADTRSPSAYVRSRAIGEAEVRKAFPSAHVVRPCVLFASDDGFLTTLVRMVRSLPALPLFGDGSIRLQPLYAGDAATAIAVIGTSTATAQAVYELGGPDIVTYRDLLQRIARRMDRRRLYVPVPFPLWFMMARAASLLPSPPLTADQVALMMDDNIANPDLPGLDQLIEQRTPLDRVLDQLLPNQR